jgi:hypothetical protein
MIKHKDSHLDHALTEAQVNHILERFAQKDSFFIETFELPEDLGTVPCGLFGPTVGDKPVHEDFVFYASRGARAYKSRLIDELARPTRTVTVIGGGHDERVDEGTPGAVRKYLTDATPIWVITHPCVLFTAFGGPLAPKEVGDLRAQCAAVKADTGLDDLLKAQQLAQLEQKLVESTNFWGEHALSSY